MDQTQEIDQLITDFLTAISLRIDANHALLDLIEKTYNKAKIELEYSTFSSPYLVKLTSFLIKINDSKTQKILKRNNKALDITKHKEILKKITISVRKNYLQNITKRIQQIFQLDSYLDKVGENIEISQYVIHILENLKKCTESELKLDEFYQQYLEKSFNISYSFDEANNEK